MEEGQPWLIDKSIVVLQPIMGCLQPLKIGEILIYSASWVRLYNLVFKGRKEKNIKVIIDEVGMCTKTDEDVPCGWTKSAPFKVMVDLQEPLADEADVAWLSEGGNTSDQIWTLVKYLLLLWAVGACGERLCWYFIKYKKLIFNFVFFLTNFHATEQIQILLVTSIE